jgi:hypothetical protein
MGYHVTILRTSNGEQIPITEDEIVAAIHGSSKFQALKDVNSEPIIEIDTGTLPNPCIWHSAGELWTKNPDEATLDGMCELASLLNARVRGDEFETYRSSSDVYYHPDDADVRSEALKTTKEIVRQTKRRSFVVHFCIFGTLLLLGILAGTCSSK